MTKRGSSVEDTAANSNTINSSNQEALLILVRISIRATIHIEVVQEEQEEQEIRIRITKRIPRLNQEKTS